MASRSTRLTAKLHDYLLSVTSREADVLARLRKETAKLEWAQMQIGADQGQFMALLVKAIGARRTLEVGVFTGYSSLAVALALPEDGRILNIAERTIPQSETPVPASGPTRAVLEVNGGTSARLGIKPGDRVRHSSLP